MAVIKVARIRKQVREMRKNGETMITLRSLAEAMGVDATQLRYPIYRHNLFADLNILKLRGGMSVGRKKSFEACAKTFDLRRSSLAWLERRVNARGESIKGILQIIQNARSLGGLKNEVEHSPTLVPAHEANTYLLQDA